MIKLYNYATHQENIYYEKKVIDKIKTLCLKQIKEKDLHQLFAMEILEVIDDNTKN